MECERELAEELIALEGYMLDPHRRKSTGVTALLADDFVEIGSSGNQYDKAQVLASLIEEVPVLVTAAHYSARRIGQDVVLITYRAWRHTKPPVHSLRSSIWHFKEGKWLLTFHQGTLTGPPMEPA